MDVEPTIEFILLQQVKAEAEMTALRQHLAETQAKHAEAQAKSDREIAAIRKLIRAGMHMIVKNEEHIHGLAEVQKKTEIKLQTFIDSLGRGGNGRHSKS